MRFLNIDSPFMQFLGKAADLMWVNILCLILCLPIFTAGAAMTAMHYVCLKIVRDEECYITKSFFKSFKENFVQSSLEWLIMLVIIFVLAGDFYLFYTGAVELPMIVQTIILAIAIFALLGALMVFPVQARFVNSISGTFKTAFAIAIIQLPKTLLMLVIYVLPLVLGYMFPQIFPLVLVFGMSVPAFCAALMYNKKFKVLEDRYLEDHPVEEETVSEEEKIFSDKPYFSDTDDGSKR